jgi:AraC-like DNA-binding protein
VENNGTDIILCLRFDYHDRNGELHMVGCNEPQLIDTAGHSLPVHKPIESFSFLLPPHFRGYVYLPFTSSYRELDGTVDAPQFTPDFHEMSRIVYYFHTYEGYKRAQLHGTERVSLGAMRLVNAQRSIDGTTVLATVRSLSYAEAHDSDERYLQSHHVSTLFNRQYYYPQGMRVSFSDGLIRLHQETAGGLPFVCTNMGCDASLVPQYPPEISRVIAYIRQNPRTLHTVAELAHLACLSESRFKEKFRRVTGVSPIQFAENVRIRESCLLLATPLSVTDIAFELGYSSAAHFSAAFRRATGIPPAQYKKTCSASGQPKTNEE